MSADVPGAGSGKALVDGVRLHYRRAGTEGPPVVLLHGAGIDDSWVSFQRAVPELADEHRVYALDWPGYGESAAIADPSTPRYADLLRGFLDDRGLDSAVLAGVSMGGAAALRFALDDPERVERLVLAASHGLGSRVPAGSFWYLAAHTPGANSLGWNLVGSNEFAVRSWLSALVHDVDALPPGFVDALQARASEAGAGSAFAAYQRNEVRPNGSLRTDFTGELEDLSVPTTLVHGAGDPVFPVEWSVRAHERLPESELVVFEDCGHWIPREKPDDFERLVADPAYASNISVDM